MPRGVREGQTEGVHAERRAQVPKGACACQTEGAHAQGSTPVRNGGSTCPRVIAHAKRRAHMPNGEFGVSRDNLGFPVKIWGFKREPVRWQRRATCPGERAHANRRAQIPNIARAYRTEEGARAESSARMPDEGRTCPKQRARGPNGGGTSPRERAPTKRSAHIPKGELMFSWNNLGFPIEDLGFSTENLGFSCKSWGFQRERTHAKQSAHVPKVARAGQMEGDQAQGDARMPIGGNACPRECAHAKRRGHKRG